MIERLAAVQALRALAALSVARSHIDNDILSLTAATGFKYSNPWPLPLEAGVDLFFVISGFVMVHASQGLFGRPGSPRVFFLRRLARIAPIYWACTLAFIFAAFALPGLISGPKPDFVSVLQSLLFWPYQNSAGAMQPVLTLGWTLNYELFFYAVFASCLGLPRRAAVAAVSGALALVIFAGLVFRPAPGALAFWSSPIIAEFVFGMLIASARNEGLRLGFSARALLIAAGIAGLAFAHQQGAPDAAWRWLAWGFPAALIISGAALAEARDGQGAAARFLSLLGDASYAMYLIHPFIIRPLRALWAKAGWTGEAGAFLFGLAALALVIAVSVAVYRWFERPLTRALQGRITVQS